MNKKQLKSIAIVFGFILMSGCSGKHVTVRDNTLCLDGCSPLPNCVSSTTRILYNRTSPFELLMPSQEAWPMIKDAISHIPRTEIMEYNDTYIHAKCRTRVFRFVDNLELVLQPDMKTVSVRSSSTIAISDLNVNRMRIYRLRNQLEKMGIIKTN
ncbi:MAG: DUF1499 domain-containing protein [Proteobacteria bacterium]|nr:DUF1499 domain-containing protein [Pseudomonadota bacterium]